MARVGASEVVSSTGDALPGHPSRGRTRREASPRASLRRTVTLRVVAVGLVAICGSMVLLGVQVQRQAAAQARASAAAQAGRSADQLAGLFGAWRDSLLVAASDSALRDWYTRPAAQPGLRDRIEALLVGLHQVYPSLIDEACYIDAGGREIARQVRGGIALVNDLSPDESGNAFFDATGTVPAGKVWQNQAYVSPDTGRWVVSNSTPIQVNGQTRAFLHFEANLDAVRAELARATGPGLRVRVVDLTTGSVIADTGSRTAVVGQPLPKADQWEGAGQVRAVQTVDFGASNANRWQVQAATSTVSPFTTGWLLIVTACVTVAIAAVAAFARRFATGIAQPVLAVTQVAEALARGDLTQRAPTTRTDEIGRMATAVNDAITAMAAQRDQIQQANDARTEQMRDNHRRQQDANRQLRRRAQSLVDDTATAVLAELDEVMARLNDVRDGADTIDAHLARTGTATRTLVDQARTADQVVDALGGSLRQVAGIADLITGITAQTKLLALNATIESARAGHAGRSFAIVAREVKDLAAGTATSTSQITTTLGDLDSTVTEVSQAIHVMASHVTSIDTAADQVTALTARQQDSVRRLTDSLHTAMNQIRAMATLSQQLERRASDRIPVTLNAHLRHAGQQHRIQVTDLSEYGAHITLPPTLATVLTVGTNLNLELKLDSATAPLTATVVRTDSAADRTPTAGINFTTHTGHGHDALLQFLNNYRSN